MMRWIFLTLLMACAYLQYQIWFDPDGRTRNIELKNQILVQTERNQKLQERNHLMHEKIMALRYDPTALEFAARKQLGMVHPDETLYSFPLEPE